MQGSKGGHKSFGTKGNLLHFFLHQLSNTVRAITTRFRADDLIEVELLLLLQLQTMSENIVGRRDAKDEVDANKPHVTPVHSPSAAICLPPEVQLPKDRLIGDSLYNSPIVFSNTFKSLYGRHAFRHVTKSTDPDPNTDRTSSKNGTANCLKDEWIKQYEPGVYITFTSLPGGYKGLKRVRFRYYSLIHFTFKFMLHIYASLARVCTSMAYREISHWLERRTNHFL